MSQQDSNAGWPLIALVAFIVISLGPRTVQNIATDFPGFLKRVALSISTAIGNVLDFIGSLLFFIGKFLLISSGIAVAIYAAFKLICLIIEWSKMFKRMDEIEAKMKELSSNHDHLERVSRRLERENNGLKEVIEILKKDLVEKTKRPKEIISSAMVDY